MIEEQNTAEEPKRTVAPQSERDPQPPAHPRPSDEADDDAAADERTSPFPYADNFSEWVADETATPDGRQHRREAVDELAGDREPGVRLRDAPAG